MQTSLKNSIRELVRVTKIIRTSPRAIIFGAFGLVVLARLIHCVVLRTQNHLKIMVLGSEIFWLTNICQQQKNAEDSILIHSRRLTNGWRIFVAQKLVRFIFVTLRPKNGGEEGIRTLVGFRPNGFQDRLVMTTSIPLHRGSFQHTKVQVI